MKNILDKILTGLSQIACNLSESSSNSSVLVGSMKLIEVLIATKTYQIFGGILMLLVL